MAVFNHTAHKALWNWLAKNPDNQKKDWPGWEWNDGEYEYEEHYCFACKYVSYPSLCKKCPLIWPDKYGCGGPINKQIGLYIQWDDETDLCRRSELAAQIRDLPVREGVECI